MTTAEEDRLPGAEFAFPRQRKEPLTDAEHVRLTGCILAKISTATSRPLSRGPGRRPPTRLFARPRREFRAASDRLALDVDDPETWWQAARANPIAWAMVERAEAFAAADRRGVENLAATFEAPGCAYQQARTGVLAQLI
jgi:hypothetical protein